MENTRNTALVIMATMGITVVPQAYAATLVETKASDVETQKMWVHNHQLRIDSSSDEYLLYFSKNNKMYMISTKDREIVDVSHGQGNDLKQYAAKIKVTFHHEGKGPEYAGYPTQKYVMKVNGIKCETNYISKKALTDSGLEPVMKAVQHAAMLGMMIKHAQNICEQADILAIGQYRKIGLPLHTVHEYDRSTSDILRIEKNVKLPQGGFTLPQGFKRMTMQQKMQQAMPPQDMKNIPDDVKAMMKKMEAQGGY